MWDNFSISIKKSSWTKLGEVLQRTRSKELSNGLKTRGTCHLAFKETVTRDMWLALSTP